MKVIQAICAAMLAGALAAGPVYAKGEVSDTWITTKVKAELTKDSDTKAHQIKVNTKSGVVVLSGNVASTAEKDKAEQDARSIKGVVNVQNNLKVQ